MDLLRWNLTLMILEVNTSDSVNVHFREFHFESSGYHSNSTWNFYYCKYFLLIFIFTFLFIARKHPLNLGFLFIADNKHTLKSDFCCK